VYFRVMRTLALLFLVLAACGPKSPPPTPAALPAPASEETSEESAAAEEPAPPEATDPRDEAKVRYLAGRKHYDLGEFDAAIVEFKAAHALYPDKSFLFNIGQAHRQAGHAPQAIDAYRRFLASDGVTADIRTQVEGYIKELGGKP
jgi:tetratricopeptide (TPR) repeat protein